MANWSTQLPINEIIYATPIDGEKSLPSWLCREMAMSSKKSRAKRNAAGRERSVRSSIDLRALALIGVLCLAGAAMVLGIDSPVAWTFLSLAIGHILAPKAGNNMKEK